MSNTEIPNEVKLRIALVNSILLCDTLISNIDLIEKLSNKDDPRLHVWCKRLKSNGVSFQNSMINFVNNQSNLYGEESFNDFKRYTEYRDAFMETFNNLLSMENSEPLFDVLKYAQEKMNELEIEI